MHIYMHTILFDCSQLQGVSKVWRCQAQLEFEALLLTGCIVNGTSQAARPAKVPRDQNQGKCCMGLDEDSSSMGVTGTTLLSHLFDGMCCLKHHGRAAKLLLQQHSQSRASHAGTNDSNA
jgi:hypothetical protein